MLLGELADWEIRKKGALSCTQTGRDVDLLSFCGWETEGRQNAIVKIFGLLQYYADANEAESWMREKMPLVTSEDYGRDETTATVNIL